MHNLIACLRTNNDWRQWHQQQEPHRIKAVKRPNPKVKHKTREWGLLYPSPISPFLLCPRSVSRFLAATEAAATALETVEVSMKMKVAFPIRRQWRRYGKTQYRAFVGCSKRSIVSRISETRSAVFASMVLSMPATQVMPLLLLPPCLACDGTISLAAIRLPRTESRGSVKEDVINC